MLSFEWNGLRAGDSVFMHDATKADSTAVPGVVSSVELHKGYNGVGVRVARKGIVWPSPLAVHFRASDERCWRCKTASDEHSESTARGAHPLISAVV